MKLLKTDNKNELVVEMILHAKRYSLTINKNKCVGCGICMEICPREAIEVTPTAKAEGEEARAPTVTINKEKCAYCGICEAICPFGAVTTRINGEHVVPVVESASFPQLIREITVDETKCGLECTEIEEPCPLDLIKVKVNSKKGKVKLKIDKESCPGCRVCETKFPEGTIHVRKILEGNLRINSEKCPEGCHDCMDVCPISGVMYVAEDGKMQVNETNCVYCGTCKIICPEEDALEFTRTRIHHTEIHSGTWNKALEKLASPRAVIKELKTKSGKKLAQVVENRCLPEVEDYV
ncbi:MAG: 4Fe-4S binding protein [Candidatus Bathyarchaeota archaeon]